MILTTRDLERLEGVHPDLVQLVRCVAVGPPLPFMVLEGMRSVEKQAENVAQGVSWTMNSRHLTGHAVDLVPLVDDEPSWNWDYYWPLAGHIKAMAEALPVRVTWGGDWVKTPDGPHWELDWDAYPLPPEEPIAV
jgi:peptidoglycan L-alanyl-D-glutamate endopeptidase CwlK